MPLLNQHQQPNNTTSTMTTSPTSDSMFNNTIDLESSLGRIDNNEERKRSCSTMQEQISFSASASSSSNEQYCSTAQSPHSTSSRPGVTRTSSRTPFLREIANSTRSNISCSLQPQPYPISETVDEIKERKRLTDSVDWSNGLVANSPPHTAAAATATTTENSNNANANADQQSMMEVTVDDFVLSAEEAGSLNDIDARTIQDDGFWEFRETPVQGATKTLSMDTDDVDMMSSVPFSVTFSSQDPCIDDDEDGVPDAAPIRSIDMEW